MKLVWIFLSLAFSCAGWGAGATSDDAGCPYLPDFVSLQQRLPRMAPLDAVKALETLSSHARKPGGVRITGVGALIGGSGKKADLPSRR